MCGRDEPTTDELEQHLVRRVISVEGLAGLEKRYNRQGIPNSQAKGGATNKAASSKGSQPANGSGRQGKNGSKKGSAAAGGVGAGVGAGAGAAGATGNSTAGGPTGGNTALVLFPFPSRQQAQYVLLTVPPLQTLLQ
jgi:hypothetical protein